MPPDSSHELTKPDDGAVLVGVAREVLTAELLGLCDEFFRHANPAVHTELRRFLTDHGHHRATGLGWFIDSLGLTTRQLSTTTPTDGSSTRSDPTPHRQSASPTGPADVVISGVTRWDPRRA
jgi:hypothetical protein